MQITQAEYERYFYAVTNIENVQVCGIRSVKLLLNHDKIVQDRTKGRFGYFVEFVQSFFTSRVVTFNRAQTNEKVDFLRSHDVRICNKMHQKLAEVLSKTPNPEDYYTLRTARLYHALFPKLQSWNQQMDARENPKPSLFARIKRLIDERLGLTLSTPSALKVDLNVKLGSTGLNVDSPECRNFVAKLRSLRATRWDHQVQNRLHVPRDLATLQHLGKLGWSPLHAKAIATVHRAFDPELAALAEEHASSMRLDRHAMDDYFETGYLASEDPYFGIHWEDLHEMTKEMSKKSPDAKSRLQFAKSCMAYARQLKIELDYDKRVFEPISQTLLRGVTHALQKSCKSISQEEFSSILEEMLHLATLDGYWKDLGAIQFARELALLVIEYGKAQAMSTGLLKALYDKVISSNFKDVDTLKTLRAEFAKIVKGSS